MLKAKSDVIHIFPEIYTLIHTQFGLSIKFIRFDNAPEISFSEFFRAKGIIFSFHSYVDSPQQNFVVKQKRQHILNVACELHFQSNIPLVYWGIVFLLLFTSLTIFLLHSCQIRHHLSCLGIRNLPILIFAYLVACAMGLLSLGIVLSSLHEPL